MKGHIWKWFGIHPLLTIFSVLPTAFDLNYCNKDLKTLHNPKVKLNLVQMEKQLYCTGNIYPVEGMELEVLSSTIPQDGKPGFLASILDTDLPFGLFYIFRLSA